VACNSKSGPRSYLGFIEGVHGVKLTQAQWHEIRILAAESGLPVGRSVVPTSEALGAARMLQAQAFEEFDFNGSDGSDITDFRDMSDEMFVAVESARVTRGTVSIVQFIADNGFEEVLAKVDARLKKVTDTAGTKL
jgi:hypothetical protein